MNRRLLIIIAAVVLTLLGTWIIVIYVSSAEERAAGNQELTNVLVPTDDIPANTSADELEQLVEVRSVPRELRPDDAITDLADVGERVTDVDLLPGEPLREARFVAPGQAGPGRGTAVDPQQQVVTISLDAQRALGGEVRKGMRVGVVVSIDDGAEVPEEEVATGTDETTTADASTGFVLNQIPVVAVSGGGAAGGGEGGGSGGGLMVSLSVDQNQAARIVFGAEHGRIWLTEQSDETVTTGGSIRTRENIYRGIED